MLSGGNSCFSHLFLKLINFQFAVFGRQSSANWVDNPKTEDCKRKTGDWERETDYFGFQFSVFCRRPSVNCFKKLRTEDYRQKTGNRKLNVSVFGS